MQIDELKRRRQQRWQLVQYLRVRDKETTEVIGHLVDISTEGVMLISEHVINPDNAYQFSMEIPHPDKQIMSVCFGARSLWTKPDINPHFHNSGFCLIDPEPDTIAAIKTLINELKHPNETADSVTLI